MQSSKRRLLTAGLAAALLVTTVAVISPRPCFRSGSCDMTAPACRWSISDEVSGKWFFDQKDQ